jgi:hypothetical protein
LYNIAVFSNGTTSNALPFNVTGGGGGAGGPLVSQVQNPEASPSGYTIGLSWFEATAANGVEYYDVYRSTTPTFTPSPSNLITQVSSPTYDDQNLSAGTYYYVIAAQDTQGNMGAPSAEVSATVPSYSIGPSHPGGVPPPQ